MRIYIDIDDVLCETAATLCGLAEKAFGKGIPYEDVKGFDLQAVFHLTDDEMEQFKVLSHAPEQIAAYPVTPGAVAGVKALAAAGHQVEIVTGRPAFTHASTAAWLEREGLGAFPVTYVNKYDRPFPAQPGDPPTVSLAELAARRYDVVIDDSPVILAKLASWSWAKVLVFARPWNASLPLAPNMTRCEGWPNVLKLL